MTIRTPGGQYFWGDNPALQALFNNRQAYLEVEFLLPHLKSGTRVVDLGCGAGSITCDIASVVAPAPVLGIDISQTAVASAQALAQTRDLTNVTFQVGDVYTTGLPSAAFDIVVICGVLSYLPEPLRAMVEASRLLAPGGVIGVREMMKEGDWFAGPHADVVAQANGLIIDGIRALGGDPFLGKRLKSLLFEAGFAGVQGRPRYSQALSSTMPIRDLVVAFVTTPHFVEGLAAKGIATDAQHAEFINKVELWAADEGSVAAIAEYIAWGGISRQP